MDLFQRKRQIGAQILEIAVRGDASAPDQNVIPSPMAMTWQNLTCDFAQAPFGPVAGDGVSDLLGTGITHADGIWGRLIRAAAPGLQNETGHDLALGAGGAQEIRTLGQGDQTQ